MNTNINMVKYIKMLKSAEIERQVEDAYNGMLESVFPGISFSYPYACDGYFEISINDKPLKCICEFKYDMNLASKTERSKILAQVLFYMKRFENDGKPLPNAIFVGDMNECFCLHTNSLLKYLDFEGIDWTKAPSRAAECSDLIIALACDEDRNAFVWKIDDCFDFSTVKAQLESFATGVSRMIHITEHNIDRIFGMFRDRVLKDSKKIQPNDIVGLFYGCICDPESNYLHPTKKNTLVTGKAEYRVDASAFKAFRQIFDYVRAPSQKKHLAAISDRLIEDTNRRRKGEFYTPTPFVDEAHKRVSAVFGENWKDEYVVVDCCCGTKNLTRDYRFKELYCLTLEQAELDISKNYNPEAVSFQFDFLNESLEDLERKAPGLIKAFRENKKILWFINPPYGRSSARGEGVGGIEKGSALTEINRQMKAAKIGACSANLYAQFLYRIMSIKRRFGLTDCNLALFCKPNYLTGGSYEKFRKEFFTDFKFENGMLFNAGHFADCSANWGINFSIWKTGETADKSEFVHDLVDLAEGEIANVGSKTLYDIDGIASMRDWALPTASGSPGIFPFASSAVKIKDKGIGVMTENALGYFYNNCNDVAGNSQKVGFFSLPFSGGMGHSVFPDNFARCCAAFAARRLIKGDWINDKDEYTKPNIDDLCYKEFESDALVYSLFDSNSQQSSLRKVEYKGKAWDVKNEFFWMSAKEIAALADNEGLDETYTEASTSPDRHMYKVLSETVLSKEAKAVLDKAVDLVRKSMKYRKLFNEDHPEYQCLNWDASYYQLKPVWKIYMKDEFEKFRSLVKILVEKMRPEVYRLNFLRG